MPLSYVSFTDKENNNCTISCCFVTILMCVTAAETTDLRCSTSTDTVGIAFFSHVWERVNLYKHHMHAIGVISLMYDLFIIHIYDFDRVDFNTFATLSDVYNTSNNDHLILTRVLENRQFEPDCNWHELQLKDPWGKCHHFIFSSLHL